MLEEILKHNREFVQSKAYEKYITNKYPDKKIAVVTCMDTRLIQLLPAAMGFKNGDIKIIKVAGGVISHPFGSAVRSLLVAVYELGVTEIMIIGHTDCGAQHMDSQAMIAHMKARGITETNIDMLRYCGIDVEAWLTSFDNTEEAVKESVELLRHHPLIPADIRIKGLLIDSITGELTELV